MQKIKNQVENDWQLTIQNKDKFTFNKILFVGRMRQFLGVFDCGSRQIRCLRQIWK